MNVTLRKASVLQTSINDAIRGIDVKTDVAINEFQDAEAEILVAATRARADIVRRDELTRALYDIRGTVAEVNQASGVNRLLTQVAETEKQIQFYTGLASKTVRLAANVVAGQVSKLSQVEAKATIYGYKNTVDTSVLSEADIADFKTTLSVLKKTKQRLQDQILEANVRNEITLSDATATTLRTEGIL
jgi:hypothetical protein